MSFRQFFRQGIISRSFSIRYIFRSYKKIIFSHFSWSGYFFSIVYQRFNSPTQCISLFQAIENFLDFSSYWYQEHLFRIFAPAAMLSYICSSSFFVLSYLSNFPSLLISCSNFAILDNDHCLKSVPITSYSGPYFSLIFPHSDWIMRGKGYLSVFSPNAGKCGKNADQNNSEYGLFTQLIMHVLS